jgi:DNA-binding NarL/FixJ family response regulator
VNTSSRLSVLVADDHALVRDGLKRVIDEQPDMVVVGEATNGEDAVAEARRLSPLIVLLDVSMPGADGVTVAQELAAACPEAKIIALTRHNDSVFVSRMLRAGAAGYVLKQSPSAELLRAMRVVATGEQYVDASLHVPSPPDVPQTPPSSEPDPGPREPLTRLEEQVLQLLARAHSHQEIARELGPGLGVDAVARLKATAMRKAGFKTGSRLDVEASEG